MNTQVTLNLLVKNNADTIEKLLDSLIGLNFDLLVADIGSSDNTFVKLKPYNPKIIKFSSKDDRSSIRNTMIEQSKNEWILYIEPFESLISGIDQIKKAIAGPVDAYSIGVVQGDIITKQVRLWHKSLNLMFSNPVFETVETKSKNLNAYIFALNQKSDDSIRSILQDWQQKNPLKPDPFYYLACYELGQNNWESFINFAEMFLHQQKRQTMSFYMTHYYLALVYCYVKKNYNKIGRAHV